jgi:hypothetical protein
MSQSWVNTERQAILKESRNEFYESTGKTQKTLLLSLVEILRGTDGPELPDKLKKVKYHHELNINPHLT